MISFVVCSVSEDKLANLRSNVERTIGVAYEFVVVDNRESGYSLCQAYNIGAAKAKYPYLCFVHEDVEFLGMNWGGAIIGKLADRHTGVIGFAGATAKLNKLSTWSFDGHYHRINIRETSGGVSRDSLTNPQGEDFSAVVVLDGLCMFVRAEVWAEVGFDESIFDGFHLYDLDFSTAVFCAGYMNYVCYTVVAEHFSKGSFSRTWLSYSKKYHDKWAPRLPLFVEPVDDVELARIEGLVHRRMTYFLVKFRLLPVRELGVWVRESIRLFPFRLDGYLMWLKLQFLKQ